MARKRIYIGIHRRKNMFFNKLNRPFGARATLALILIAALTLSLVGTALATGGVGSAAGFEDDDGDLTPNDTPNFDWNNFAPTTWTGTSPYRQADAFVSGWTFKGIEDAQIANSDTAFAGGTKQDDNCPTVNTGKAPNKDDLKRIYLASKVVDGHTYLMLSWLRIPQNTTSPSAHIGFEFNKGTDGPCGGNSDGLMKRVAGDMLIVYDFEGGATDTPVITLRLWVTSGTCEVGSVNPPCWGPATNLSALGYAEAKVNTFGSVSDELSPSPPESLGTNEFGEAGIDLTDAGVFEAGSCESFGTAFGVSRSSGNSGTAQMKDLIGPADFTLANCGTVIIHKVTDPAGDTTTDFGYTTNVTTTPSSTTSPFSLKDGETNTIVNVNPGSNLHVTEDDPGPSYLLTDIDCSASTVPGGNYSTDTSTRAVTFSIGGGETLECTFTNTLQRGAILVTKTRKHAADGPGDHPHSGVSFTVNGETSSTDGNGQVCFDGLPFGNYDAVETVPSGYVADGDTTQSVTVDNNAKCTDDPYVGETVSFSNTPLTDITVSVNSQVNGGTASTIDCTIVSGSTDSNGDGSVTALDLQPGTYVCTIVIDP
jgi:hypothetical protein